MTIPEYLSRQISRTFDPLLMLLEKFTPAQLNQVPFEGSWTAGQVVEHILICGSSIPDQVTGPATRPFDEKVNVISDLFLDFTVKFQAAPALAPQKTVHQKAKLLGQLRSIRDHHLETSIQKDPEALCMVMELPTLGLLTRYEWIHFICVHTQRHTHQIQNIYSCLQKTSAGN